MVEQDVNRVPMHRKNLENKKLNFYAWKSLGKRKEWKNLGNFRKIHVKLKLSIFLEEINGHEGYSSIFYQKLLSWKILILTLESPGEMHLKKCETVFKIFKVLNEIIQNGFC